MNKIFFRKEINSMQMRAKQSKDHFSFFPGETVRLYDHENVIQRESTEAGIE